MKDAVVLLAAAAVFAQVSGCSDTKPAVDDGARRSESGVPAEANARDFTLKDLNGREISLKDYKDMTVMLVFWATWCPNCRAEVAELAKINSKHSDRADFSILAVSIDDDINRVKKFAKKYKIGYTVLHDPGAVIEVAGSPRNTVDICHRPRRKCRIVWN